MYNILGIPSAQEYFIITCTCTGTKDTALCMWSYRVFSKFNLELFYLRDEMEPAPTDAFLVGWFKLTVIDCLELFFLTGGSLWER